MQLQRNSSNGEQLVFLAHQHHIAAPLPYGVTVGGEMVDMSEFVRNNAGKAFEFMLEVVEEDRKAAGLPDIATARAEGAEVPKVR